MHNNGTVRLFSFLPISESPFDAGGSYPLVTGSASFLTQPVAASSTPWAQTAAGIATITVSSIAGLILIGALVAGALYMFARKRTVQIPDTPESGPDVRWE